MSLDVSLIASDPIKKQGTGVFIRDAGKTRELTQEEVAAKFPGAEVAPLQSFETTEVYTANITHNLGNMANKAGVYYALWRPDEKNWQLAKEIIKPLEDGLKALKSHPAAFKKLNPENGWGSYDGLVEFVEEYLKACREYPEALIEVSR